MRIAQQVRNFATAIREFGNFRPPYLFVVDPTKLSPSQRQALVDAGALRVTVHSKRLAKTA